MSLRFGSGSLVQTLGDDSNSKPKFQSPIYKTFAWTFRIFMWNQFGLIFHVYTFGNSSNKVFRHKPFSLRKIVCLLRVPFHTNTQQCRKFAGWKSAANSNFAKYEEAWFFSFLQSKQILDFFNGILGTSRKAWKISIGFPKWRNLGPFSYVDRFAFFSARVKHLVVFVDVL